MSRKNLTLLVTLVLLVAIIGLLKYKTAYSKSYSVVYLQTGEVYVGHLTTFPDMELKDSYILQVTKNAKDTSKNDFQLQPIAQALWASQSLHLNRNKVVFYGSILPDSKIGMALAGK